MYCPSAMDITRQAFALLPRGRAWQSHDGGPEPPVEAGFSEAGFAETGFSTKTVQGTILFRFWRAVAEVLAFLVARACALRLEFWCATHSETHDLWMREYGLPDPCDPFPDLCTKVAAIGGARCEYYAAIAARAGWSITCALVPPVACGARAGNAVAGCATVGGQLGGAVLSIVVYLRESPAYVGGFETLPYAGKLLAGQMLACEPDISPLTCILDRVVHAHVAVVYAINEG